MQTDYQYLLRKRAYREAGHVVAAHEFDFQVYKVSIVEIEGNPPSTKLPSIDQLLSVAKTETELADIAQKYAMTRLAGPAAEMNYAAERFRVQNHIVNWPRWSKCWRSKLFYDEDVDADSAYAIAFAWSNCKTGEELRKRFQQLWRQTELLLLRKDNWDRTERLSHALLKKDVLTGKEAIQVIEAA